MKALIALFAKAYGWLILCASLLQHPILLIVRLYWGWGLLQSGVGKFHNIDKVIGFFGDDLHIPYPKFSAYLTASTECIGGLLLMVGLVSRLISIPLTILLIVAFATADNDKWVVFFSDPDTFMKATPFLFLGAVVLVFAFGPGVFSLDWVIGWIYRKKRRNE